MSKLFEKDKKMKTTNVLFTFGGITHYIDALLNKIVDKGVKVTVVLPKTGNTTIGKGVKMVEGGKYNRLYSNERKMWYGKSALEDLPKIISQEQPDIVVMGWPYFLQVELQPGLKSVFKATGSKLILREIPFQTPPYGKIKSYFAEHPMVTEDMSVVSQGTAFYVKQWIISLIRKRCYRFASATLNYSTVAYDILPSYGVDKDKINVTFNSTDTNSLMRVRDIVVSSKPILPASSQRILHIGRLVKWKRVDLLISAFAEVHKRFPDSELVIVGKGPELENLMQQAKNIGLEDKCKFVGAIYEPERLGAYMYESSVYVLAGMGGLSINDAMTYSMPIVCSVCDGTERDLVNDGVNGYFFKEGDANDLASKIEKIISNPELAEKMGEESFKIIQDKININTVSDRFVKAFNSVMTSN